MAGACSGNLQVSAGGRHGAGCGHQAALPSLHTTSSPSKRAAWGLRLEIFLEA